ncbi:MAG: hypothetical protein ACXACW_11315 [Candidatus Hodarchaeales archaeon]
MADGINKAMHLELWKLFPYPEGAKFYTGDAVIITMTPRHLKQYEGTTDYVLWANHGDGYEYILENYPYMIYEKFLTSKEE